MPELLPLFLNVTGRQVVLVGGGRVAAAKLRQLLAVGARVRVIAPEVSDEIISVGIDRARPGAGAGLARPNVEVDRRAFRPSDLDDAWFVVAAATPEDNREIAAAAEQRRLFVNAVDDPANASAYLSGVVRRDGVTVAISTSGDAPALTALLREAIERLLPPDLRVWMDAARRQRVVWRRERIPMDARKPLLLDALNGLYAPSAEAAAHAENTLAQVPWLSAPEDSWL
jgi:siroheme synthase-like protein